MSGMASGRHETIRAELLVGAEVTRYLRAGTGPPVVLLRRSEIPDALWSALRLALIARYRVLSPELGVRADFAGWLGAFFDGLGITRASLVADDAVADVTIAFARENPDRIPRVVVLSSVDGLGVSLDGVPTLIVSRESRVEEAIGEITAFLESDSQRESSG